jgi:translocation and assembly module TamB
VKKKLAYGLMIIVLIVAAAAAGLLVWVLTTYGGAIWLLGVVSDRTSLEITVRKAGGSLAGGLELSGLTVKWPGGEAGADEFYFNLDMTSLLSRELRAEEIVLRGARVTAEAGEEKPAEEFRWPRVSGLPVAIRAGIDRLDISNAAYSSPGSSPFMIERLSARVEWRWGTLSVKDLSARMEGFAVEGNLSLGLARPGAEVDMELRRLDAGEGGDRLSLSADLSSAKSPEIVAGPVKAKASLDKGRKVSLEGVFAVTGKEVRGRQVSMTEEGRPGRILLDGEAVFFPSPASFAITAEMDALDLSSEAGREAVLSGNIVSEGTPDDYHGEFNLRSKGAPLLIAELAGEFQGNTKGATVESIEGSWLGGSVRGDFESGWEDSLSFSGSVAARDLDPSFLNPRWHGQINLDVSGSARFPEGVPREISLSGRLHESTLMAHALTGEIEAHVSGVSVDIRSLELHGRDFDLSGRGNISERLSLEASVSDLSSLVPDAGGSISARGWVRWRDDMWTGEFSGRGADIIWTDLEISSADIEGSAVSDGEESFDLGIDAKGVRVKEAEFSSLKFKGEGTLGSHNLSLGLVRDAARMQASLSGGYRDEVWRGRIVSLSGADPAGNWKLVGPAELTVNPKEVTLGRTTLSGGREEKIELEASLHLKPLRGTIYGQWQKVDLSRPGYWVQGISLSGSSSGKIDISIPAREEMVMKGEAAMSGRFETAGRPYEIRRANVDFSWDRHGLDAHIDLHLAEGGALEARITSPEAASFSLPSRAGIEGNWHGLDVGVFAGQVPGLEVEGELAGDFQGSLFDDAFDMEGGISLSGGAVQYRTERGRITADVKDAAVVWQWRGDTLSGSILFALEEFGRVEGEFQLPVPARFPVSPFRKGALKVSLNGRVREEGIVTSLFPGLIQKGRGELEFALTVGGTPERPVFGGAADLSKAGAYLPAGGIHIEGFRLSASLSADKVMIDSFYAESGGGHIEGSAVIGFSGWKLEKYEGKIKGDKFQTVYLPELRVTTSPDLTFEGDREKVAIRGTLRVPELRVFEKKGKEPVQPSEDVVVVDAPERKESGGPPVAIDLRVNVILGEKIFVKAEGIDARLKGEVELASATGEEIRGKGEISVAEGRYKAYGVDLKIIRGRLIFAGGPVNEPSLDVFAARQTRDVLAGVLVSGIPQTPLVNLYSEPSLSDTDILAYMVLGHPLGASSEQADLVMRAAGALLSASESVVFRNQLQERLGIDTLEIQSGGGDVSESLITVGKYLTPNLYVSYGRSIFTEAGLVKLRYSFSKRLELESRFGEESGVDLYYKIDFK